MKYGLLFAGAWICVLIASFIAYPGSDNLVTGFLIHALFGVDALGRMSAADVLAVAGLQVSVLFGLGYLIGMVATQFRDS